MTEAFPCVAEWAQEGYEEAIREERDRYRRERDELLMVLFQPYATRLAVSRRIVPEDENERELDSRGNSP